MEETMYNTFMYNTCPTLALAFCLGKIYCQFVTVYTEYNVSFIRKVCLFKYLIIGR